MSIPVSLDQRLLDALQPLLGQASNEWLSTASQETSPRSVWVGIF